MKARIKSAIAHAETLGLIDVTRTALGEWLRLRSAAGDHANVSGSAASLVPESVEPRNDTINTAAAGTTPAPAGAEPEGASSDGDPDDNGPAVVVSEADVESFVALCWNEFTAGNAQLGLTYVRMQLRHAAGQLEQWKLARLRLATSVAVGRGLVSVHATPFGEWVVAPGTVPRLFADPSAFDAGAHAPHLLAFASC
jgi:hypothetical protein